jgi:hypothetical protein
MNIIFIHIFVTQFHLKKIIIKLQHACYIYHYKIEFNLHILNQSFSLLLSLISYYYFNYFIILFDFMIYNTFNNLKIIINKIDFFLNRFKQIQTNVRNKTIYKTQIIP